MEQHLARIAAAFERIAGALENISREGLELHSKPECLNLAVTGEMDCGIEQASLILQGPLLLQHEFSDELPLGLLHIEPNQRAIKVELSNCTDTETPLAVQIHD